MNTERFRVEIIRDPVQFEALEPAWNELYRRADEPYLAQGFAWQWQGWRARPEEPNQRLICVAIREADAAAKLVGVWTFTVRRDALRSIARPLGGGGHDEYGGPLIESGPDEVDIAALLWQQVRRIADRIDVFNLPPKSPICAIIARSERVRITHPLVSPITDMRRFPEWPAFRASLSKGLRHDLDYQARRLRRAATVTLGRITEPREKTRMVRWIIERKRAWLRAHRLEQSAHHARWTMTENCVRFFTAMAAMPDGGAGNVAIFALCADGQPIAGGITVLYQRKMEFYVITYDPAWASYSPGKLLTECCLNWAFDHGCVLDYRIVATPFKALWANAERHVVTHYVGARPLGYADILLRHWRLAARRAQRALIKRLPEAMAQRLRRLTGRT